MTSAAPIRLVCLDVDGTLTDGASGPALPGAVEAVRALRARWPVRLVTNTTSVPFEALAKHLAGLELLDDPSHLHTPVMVARRISLTPATIALASIAACVLTAATEYAWYALATGINPMRVFMANFSIAHGLRPALITLVVGLGVAAFVYAKSLRKIRSRATLIRQSAAR